MPQEELGEYERALHHAARLQGLSLIRTGDTFALVDCKLAGATLDEIAAYLAADRGSENEDRCTEISRRTDLRAMLKAERALIAELEEEKRKCGEPHAQHATAEAALAEIRRRIAEIQEGRQHALRTEQSD